MARFEMNQEQLKQLGQGVKRKRESEGLNLRELAGKIRVSASTLSRIENDKFEPNTETLRKVEAWLGDPGYTVKESWLKEQADDLRAGRVERVLQAIELALYALKTKA